MINYKNILSGIFYKVFGADFIRKHVTTLIATLGGIIEVYVKTHGIDIDSNLLARWLHDTGNISFIFIAYFVGLLFDLKPSTPKVVKE